MLLHKLISAWSVEREQVKGVWNNADIASHLPREVRRRGNEIVN